MSEPDRYSAKLARLRAERRDRKGSLNQSIRARGRLTPAERRQILLKTRGRCHLCGGAIRGSWQADHVFAFSGGGAHAVDNYLPAHALCNNYRWDYSAREFQEILKLGVWVRTQIELRSELGRAVAEQFVAYERKRKGRRRAVA